MLLITLNITYKIITGSGHPAFLLPFNRHFIVFRLPNRKRREPLFWLWKVGRKEDHDKISIKNIEGA